MAKVYSWEISQNPKKYAYIVSPKDTTKVYIGNELNGNNLEKVKEWAATCTDEEYKEQFEQMVNLCNSSGYNVKFETFTNYIGVDTSCDNLRGPAGKGIEHIALHSIDTTRNVSRYAIYYDDGTIDTFEIQNGKDGRDGIDGKPGAKGDTGVSSKFVMVYTSGVDEYGKLFTPSRPEGGLYDFIKNEMTYPLGWSPNDTTLTPPVWMSSRTFSSSEASTDKQWSLPVQITGDAGAPGKDGSITEFIYCLDDNKPSVENLESKNESGYFPPESGWTPSPTGVSETHVTEWCSMRKLNRETNIWGPWETPFIWSKYGVNGQDGDGVQYIYLKNRGEVPLNPTPYDFATNKDYQNRDTEWIPKKDEKYINKNGETVIFSAIENVTDESKVPAGVWTDNPSDVTADYHSQWVSTRKYRKNSDGVMVWEAYSNPALWAKFGQDGKSATTIRKLYALSPSTQDKPEPPTSSTITGDWGTGFPKDYESGKNVVWCTEAELWANNFEFVKSYQLVSTKDEENNIIPPKDYEDNYIDVSEIPSEEVPTFKYVRFNGEYYEWIAQSWCEPYIITGLKGEPGSPVDYTTYVFAFAYTNHIPNPPEGESSKNPGNSTDDLGNIIKWVDYPKSDENGYGVDGYVDENGNEMRWYQCIGYVDGYDGHIKNWGDVCPCNGRDGNKGTTGNYIEIRFGVTKNSIKPSFDEYEIVYDEKGDVAFYKPYREPLLKDDAGNIVGWFTSDEKLPDITDGGVMWQIWALIDGETNEVIEQNGHAWNGPRRVSGEKGEQGIQGPAGMRGVTGIPGAKALNMYCLGTYGGKNSNSENYWETGGVHGGDGYFGSKNWLSGATPKDMIDWYLSNEMPYADVIEVSSAEEATTVAKAINNNDGTLANRGRVIKLIDVTTSDVFHTYFLVTHKGELRELTQPLSVEKSEDFNVYVWCIQGNEVWKSGPYEKYVDITRYDDDGDVIPPEDADSNNTKPKNELPTEKDEFCKYVYYDSKYYEWKEIDGDKVQHVLEKIEWGSPFKLQGTNGLRGLPGSRGQVVYPMGIYNHEEVYITTDDKAPYVYDPTDGMYYVYNIVGEPWVGRLPGYNEETGEYDESVYKNIRDNDGTFKYSIDGTGNDGTWMGDQDGDTPANNYANKTNNNEKPAWVRFESFQALYTSIGIIENGMIGSAVYNNEFMFSQQGIDQDGNPTTYAVISPQGTTYGFLSGYEYDEKGDSEGRHWKYRNGKYIDNTDVNPYEKNTSGKYLHTFIPNVCINFSTGQMWASAGKNHFNYNGTGYLADEAIKWWFADNNKVAVQIGKDEDNGIRYENGTLTIGPLNTYKNSLQEDLEILQKQIDKKAETFYGPDVPSSDWSTDSYNTHIGDMWYNTSNTNGYAINSTYRWSGTQWIKQNIPTSVFDRIDGKSSIFVDTPNSDTDGDGYLYHKSDLWFKDGEIYRATITRTTTEGYKEKDWVKACDYTDDTVANQAIGRLEAWADDEYISPQEVNLLKKEYTSVQNLHESILNEAKSFGMNNSDNAYYKTYDTFTKDYTNAKKTFDYYTDLDNAVKTDSSKIYSGSIKIENTGTGPDGKYYGNIVEYYTSRQNMQNALVSCAYNKSDSYSDELKSIFGTVTDNNGALLSGYLGIKDTDDNRIVTALDGSGIVTKPHDDSWWANPRESKLILAAGIPGPKDGEYVEGETFKKSMSKAYTRIFDDGTFITKKMLVNDEIDAGCMKTDLQSLRIRNEMNGGQNQILLDRQNGISFLTNSAQSVDKRWKDVQILLGRNFESTSHSHGEIGARVPFNRPGIQSIITDIYFGTDTPYEVTSYDKEYDKAYISTLYLDCKTYNKETNSSNGYVSYNDYAICSPHGTFAGLRPKIIYLTKGSYSLTELDHTIILNNETKDAATTLTLPSSPIDGQEYFIYQIKRGGDFRIKTGSSSIGLFSMNGNALKTFKEGNTTVNGDTFSNDNNWFVNIIFCKAYGNWIMRYNSYS